MLSHTVTQVGLNFSQLAYFIYNPAHIHIPGDLDLKVFFIGNPGYPGQDGRGMRGGKGNPGRPGPPGPPGQRGG